MRIINLTRNDLLPGSVWTQPKFEDFNLFDTEKIEVQSGQAMIVYKTNFFTLYIYRKDDKLLFTEDAP